MFAYSNITRVQNFVEEAHPHCIYKLNHNGSTIRSYVEGPNRHMFTFMAKTNRTPRHIRYMIDLEGPSRHIRRIAHERDAVRLLPLQVAGNTVQTRAHVAVEHKITAGLHQRQKLPLPLKGATNQFGEYQGNVNQNGLLGIKSNRP